MIGIILAYMSLNKKRVTLMQQDASPKTLKKLKNKNKPLD